MWCGIKQIISLKSNNKFSPSKIELNHNVYTGSKTIANAFNEYFAGIGSKLAQSIPSVNRTPCSFLPARLQNSFYLNPVTSYEIENEILNLNCTKSTGPFSIPINILKIVKTFVSKPLEVIFNISFQTGIVPDKFELARVIPVFKDGSKIQLSNYRPISLLSVFNKILETLMQKRLLKFLDK